MVSFFYSMNYDDDIPEETGYETGPPIPCFNSTPGCLHSGIGMMFQV
jgi:hypothetical protein